MKISLLVTVVVGIFVAADAMVEPHHGGYSDDYERGGVQAAGGKGGKGKGGKGNRRGRCPARGNPRRRCGVNERCSCDCVPLPSFPPTPPPSRAKGKGKGKSGKSAKKGKSGKTEKNGKSGKNGRRRCPFGGNPGRRCDRGQVCRCECVPLQTPPPVPRPRTRPPTNPPTVSPPTIPPTSAPTGICSEFDNCTPNGYKYTVTVVNNFPMSNELSLIGLGCAADEMDDATLPDGFLSPTSSCDATVQSPGDGIFRLCTADDCTETLVISLCCPPTDPCLALLFVLPPPPATFFVASDPPVPLSVPPASGCGNGQDGNTVTCSGNPISFDPFIHCPIMTDSPTATPV